MQDTLTPPRLFTSRKDFLAALALFTLVLLVSLSFKYSDFLQLKRFTWHTIEALVIDQKSTLKEGKPQHQLRLEYEGRTFFTTSRKKLRDLRGHVVTLTLYTAPLSFIDFLQGSYVSSALKGVYAPLVSRYAHITHLHKAHQDPLVANLYGALYFVEPVHMKLRTQLSLLGVNHLAALSGFHLGFLALLLTMIAKLFYAPVHTRFVPYRSFSRDVMVFILLVLFAYVAYLGFPPALLRAFVMMSIGFYLYDRGLKMLSFQTLGVAIACLIALMPQLVFMIGFWLSVGGVWMLFILLIHFEHLSKTALFLGINVGVYLLMAPYIAALFGQLSPAQLASPLLSMLFVLFYPISIVLHLLGWGWALDGILVDLLTLKLSTVRFEIPQGFLLIYSLLILGAARYKSALVVALLFSFLMLVLVLL